VEDWALIRRLAAEGVPKARIAAELGVSRTTVIKAVDSTAPPRYERRPAATSFTSFEDRVRELLAAAPSMPATVIAERIGWTGSERWLRQNVARLRPEYRRIDPADRLTWSAGDAVQCDLWFPPAKIPLPNGTATLLPVLVMVAAFSRFTMAVMLPTRTTADLLLGMWHLLGQLGAVPRRLIWDNEAGIGRGKRKADGVEAFIGSLATRLVQLKPYDPESKGVVERRNGWLETSFMPGRTFTSPTDFNAQLGAWLPLGNARVVRTIKAAPIDRLAADVAAMLPLPTAPLHLGWRARIRLGRDYYVPIAGNDYSVDPTAIRAMVDVTADLDRVRVKAGGRIVADHARVWGSGQTITDPVHVQAAARLRSAFQKPATVAGRDEAGLLRDLSDYDRAFGIEVI